MTRLMLVLLLSTVALAQERRTAAEELFEKAWWEETASGALDKALEGYRKAADAEGPASIRARALYRAAAVEQRLGRTDVAVGLLERLAKDFPGETDLLKEAKARLQEWTAVDLRKSFADWYRSYVFSPEFQARVVDLVLRMGSAKEGEWQEAWGQLLTIGEASVPALQEALKSSNTQLRGRATKALLCLGVVPPTDALIANREWANGDSEWLTLYRADEATRRRVREEAKGDAPLARAVRAVATSPEEILAVVRTEQKEHVYRLLVLLLDHSGGDMRKRVVDLVRDPELTVSVAAFLRGWLPKGPDDVDVRQCIEWARTLRGLPARQVAARWAAQKLTEKSEEDLDAVLALIPGPAGALSDLAEATLDGLVNNARFVRFAWTSARVGPLLDLLTPAKPGEVSRAEQNLSSLLYGLRSEAPGGYALADALLDRAARFRENSPLATLTQADRQIGGGTVPSLFGERLIARWPKASVEDKIALLNVATRHGRADIVNELRDGLMTDAYARGTDVGLRRAISLALGGIHVTKLLASFDLSKAEDAEAAIEALENIRTSLDDATAAAMGEFLIYAKSPIRKRALQLLVTWKWQMQPALLPAAKAVAADEDPVVRRWAIDRLADWNSFEASPFLAKALTDPEGWIRAAAARGLARVGREDAVPALVKLLDDPDPSVREPALAALEQIRKVVDQKKAWQLEQAGFR